MNGGGRVKSRSKLGINLLLFLTALLLLWFLARWVATGGVLSGFFEPTSDEYARSWGCEDDPALYNCDYELVITAEDKRRQLPWLGLYTLGAVGAVGLVARDLKRWEEGSDGEVGAGA